VKAFSGHMTVRVSKIQVKELLCTMKEVISLHRRVFLVRDKKATGLFPCVYSSLNIKIGRLRSFS
jgi:uncharacterized Zn-finger protein